MVGADLVVACFVGLVLRDDDDVAGARSESPEARVRVERGGFFGVGTFGTNRFCAACLVTPMHLPISVHDAPDLRAWSTKWPIRWSAISPRVSAASTASVS